MTYIHCETFLFRMYFFFPLFCRFAIAMKPNVTTFSVAAEEKGCGRATIYRAVEDGRLNTAKIGKRNMILRDEKYEQFTPKNTGFRKQKQANNDG